MPFAEDVRQQLTLRIAGQDFSPEAFDEDIFWSFVGPMGNSLRTSHETFTLSSSLLSIIFAKAGIKRRRRTARFAVHRIFVNGLQFRQWILPIAFTCIDWFDSVMSFGPPSDAAQLWPRIVFIATVQVVLPIGGCSDSA